MWFSSSPLVKLADSALYEAFPVAATNSAGLTVAAWGRGVDHYSQSEGRMARMLPGSTVWTAPVAHGGGWRPVSLATSGDRFALLEMESGPYRGRVSTSTDGVTWSEPVSVTWAGGLWAFPCDLCWVDDGTPDGLLLATAYGGAGTTISASTDAGATWGPWAALPLHDFAGGGPGSGSWNEASLVQTVDDRLLMLIRHEPAPGPRIAQLVSDDQGLTWSLTPQQIPGALSQPNVTRLDDGTLILLYRDKTRNDAHSVAQSSDNGATWITTAMGDGWNMYGQFAPRPDGRAVVVAGTQERGNPRNADIEWGWFSHETAVGVSGWAPSVEPAIDLTFAEIPAGTATLRLERVVDGVVTPVRGASGLLVAGTTGTHLDTEPPCGRGVSYRVTAIGPAGETLGTGVSSPVMVPDPALSCVWLSDPLDDTSPMQVLVTSATPLDMVTDVTTAAPSGQPLARVYASTTRVLPEWQLVVKVTGPQVVRFREFLAGAAHVLVRPGSKTGYPGAVYGTIRSATPKTYWSADGTPVREYWTLAVTRGEGPGLDKIQPRWTWADLAQYCLDNDVPWSRLGEHFPTWADVKRGV